MLLFLCVLRGRRRLAQGLAKLSGNPMEINSPDMFPVTTLPIFQAIPPKLAPQTAMTHILSTFPSAPKGWQTTLPLRLIPSQSLDVLLAHIPRISTNDGG